MRLTSLLALAVLSLAAQAKHSHGSPSVIADKAGSNTTIRAAANKAAAIAPSARVAAEEFANQFADRLADRFATPPGALARPHTPF